MTSTRLMLEWAILLALAITGAAFLHASGTVSRIDNQVLDTASALTRPAPLDDIVIVEIDDRSLEALVAVVTLLHHTTHTNGNVRVTLKVRSFTYLFLTQWTFVKVLAK